MTDCSLELSHHSSSVVPVPVTPLRLLCCGETPAPPAPPLNSTPEQVEVTLLVFGGSETLAALISGNTSQTRLFSE